MTTVAVSRKQIAADRQLTHSSGMKFRGASKLSWVDTPLYPKKFVVGFCGNIDVCLQVLEYFDPERDIRTDFRLPKEYKSTEYVVLTEDSKIFSFIHPHPSKWVEIQGPYYAIGSGSHFAMGAMVTGKTPLEAVKAASKLDPNTGMGYAHYTL